MSGDPQQEVAAAIRNRVAARAAPGIIGTTTPQALLVTGAPWSAAQIELWRDTELAWANTALVDGLSAPDPDRIARVGLALADTRVRDVVLALTVREARAAQVAEGLWPVVTSLPHPWRTPAGTVLAWTEWVQGRDPVAVLDLAEVGHGYRLADMLRTAAAGGVVGDVTRAFTDGALEDYRYGTEDVDIAWKAAADQHVVLGEALNRAGWSLHVSVVEPDAGRLVGYLLHDHTRVAVVQARVDFDPTDALVAAAGALDFGPHSTAAGDWRAVVGNAGVTDGAAVEALVLARSLDLAYPQAAARLATSPTVIAATDHLLTAGPTRGPRLT